MYVLVYEAVTSWLGFGSDVLGVFSACLFFDKLVVSLAMCKQILWEVYFASKGKGGRHF